MQFPVYQVPYLGNGMTIALVAVLHVIISHGFAIGAIIMIVLSECIGHRKQNEEWEAFAKDYIKFTIIIITGVGSVTGAGIWLFTSALAPRAIGSLLRVFFWPWLIEWGVFLAELILLLIYYYTWIRWIQKSKLRHMHLGILYCAFAICSAVLISGILGFMLTSDHWPWDQNFWSGYFNPTYLPQIALRLSVAFMFGALISMAVLLFTRRSRTMQREGLKLFGKIFLLFLPLCALAGWWYFDVVPSSFKTFAQYSILTSKLSQNSHIFWWINGVAAAFLFIFAVGSISGSKRFAKLLIIPAVLTLIGFIGEYERIREFIRGPYLMPGYMYANQFLLEEKPYYDQHGMLDNDYWYQVSAPPDTVESKGADLFGRNCSMCHTIGGLNDIRERVAGRTTDGIAAIIAHAHEMIPFMPPFSGRREEGQVMAQFLHDLASGAIELNATSRFVPERKGESHE